MRNKITRCKLQMRLTWCNFKYETAKDLDSLKDSKVNLTENLLFRVTFDLQRANVREKICQNAGACAGFAEVKVLQGFRQIEGTKVETRAACPPIVHVWPPNKAITTTSTD